MNQVERMPWRSRSARMRGAATTPNSPREIGVGVVMPRAMKPEIASKSKVRQTICRGMAWGSSRQERITAAGGDQSARPARPYAPARAPALPPGRAIGHLLLHRLVHLLSREQRDRFQAERAARGDRDSHC